MSDILDERRIVIEKTEDAKLTLVLFCEPEHIEIRGNCMVSGDDEADEECARSIEQQLNDGNVWAWCSVGVYAELQLCRPVGGGVRRHETIRSDTDYLGGCSYASAEDFMEPGGYFDDMKASALASIRERDPRVKDALAESLLEVMKIGFPGIQHTIDTKGEEALVPALQRARALLKQVGKLG